jgi:hypothetical protein
MGFSCLGWVAGALWAGSRSIMGSGEGGAERGEAGHTDVAEEEEEPETNRWYSIGTIEQCCGSMTFWCGSRSADPCLWLDPDIFVINLQDANKKLVFKKNSAYYRTFESIFTSFFKDKSQKEVATQ